MKGQQDISLFSALNRVKREMDIFVRPEARAGLIKVVDDLIASLKRLRDDLGKASLEARTAEISGPLGTVISFLEQAKSDESLQTLLSLAGLSTATASKREVVEIPSNLTNDQIRALLEKDLSKAELKVIARQRGISVGKLNNLEIRRSILKNLERQEGYARLSSY